VTDQTADQDLTHVGMLRLVAEVIGAVALALAAAAATVVVVAWINTWEDVQGEAGLADFLFWPLAAAALTLQVKARRMRSGTQ
jgi:hypothetical protein